MGQPPTKRFTLDQRGTSAAVANRSEWNVGLAPGAGGLLQVTANQVHELFSRLGLLGFRIGIGADDMEPNVVLDDLGHEAVDRSAAGGDGLQHALAVGLL